MLISDRAFHICFPSFLFIQFESRGCSASTTSYGQLIRLKFPAGSPTPPEHFRKNRWPNMVALTLFVQAPVGLLYGNQCRPRLGFWLPVIMACAGICATQIATLKYPYTTQNKEEI